MRLRRLAKRLFHVTITMCRKEETNRDSGTAAQRHRGCRGIHLSAHALPAGAMAAAPKTILTLARQFEEYVCVQICVIQQDLSRLLHDELHVLL